MVLSATATPSRSQAAVGIGRLRLADRRRYWCVTALAIRLLRNVAPNTGLRPPPERPDSGRLGLVPYNYSNLLKFKALSLDLNQRRPVDYGVIVKCRKQPPWTVSLNWSRAAGAAWHGAAGIQRTYRCAHRRDNASGISAAEIERRLIELGFVEAPGRILHEG